MKMTPEERARIEALQRDWITPEEAKDIVGVNPWDPSFEGVLLAYGQTLRSSPSPFKDGYVSRFILEGFLQDHRFMTERAASVRLGMTQESFLKVLGALEERGLVPPSRGCPVGTVSFDVVDNIHQRLPGPHKKQLFISQSDYCAKLHTAIKNQLGIEVDPLYCETSQALKEMPLIYAYDYCRISKEPTGLPNRIYMNFGKPLRLAPDICSRLFFFRHQEELNALVLGSPPELGDLAAAGV